MSREIIEAVQTIEREKGIDEGTLVQALEDALLAAYKKTPGAARHAVVELDDEGEFRVFSIELPAELEPKVTYGAGVVRKASQPGLAGRFVDGLATGDCADALAAAGFGATGRRSATDGGRLKLRPHARSLFGALRPEVLESIEPKQPNRMTERFDAAIRQGAGQSGRIVKTS